MAHALQFFIDGAWVDPAVPNRIPVIDPSTEEAFSEISFGSEADVDRAVAAAKRAFATFGFTSPAERLELLRRVVVVYERRMPDIADAVSREMGAPRPFALSNQVGIGLAHLRKTIEVLERFAFSEVKNTSLVAKEPVGVVGLITPWNWPLNQITCEVAPALAAGCTMVLKPSEIAPLNAVIFAEVLDEAGVPPGVLNFFAIFRPTVPTATRSRTPSPS